MKELSTGVRVYYNKDGSIKYVYSPYYEKQKNNPIRGSVLRYLANRLKELIK